MGNEEIEIFHEQLETTLSPYLSEYYFYIDSKQIDEGIGSYGVVFKRNNKCISLEFCMHHYDLFDGIKVSLYYENDLGNILTVNSLNEGEYKIYSQLKPEKALSEIILDLKSYCKDFININD